MGFVQSLEVISTLPFLALSIASTRIDPDAYNSSSTITRDICIIGGGSSGTYGAIGLQGLNKSVVVVEIKDRLGGHTQTYTDPITNVAIDYGVVVWRNSDIVKDYFARFDIPLANASLTVPGETYEFVDFRTGKNVFGYAPLNASAALAAYGAQLAKYSYLEAGFYLPDPIPADLLLPFREFIQKYALGAAVQTIFSFAQGLGDLLCQPTLYVMKNFGQGVLEGYETSFLATANHDNSELYEKAQAELGQDVLLQTRVIATDRSGEGVKVLVQMPEGLKLILAKKLLISIPPKLTNLAGFDLSTNETNLFSQYQNSAYYTGLLRNTNIPSYADIINIGANTSYNLPVLPGLYGISPTGVSGLHGIKYGSATQLSDDEVKADIIASVQRMGAARTFNATTPDFAVFSSHTPFELTVSTEAIQAGFYKDLYALQGQRNTYYTGAAFHTQDSSLLWHFTEALLPSIVASINR